MWKCQENAFPSVPFASRILDVTKTNPSSKSSDEAKMFPDKQLQLNSIPKDTFMPKPATAVFFQLLQLLIGQMALGSSELCAHSCDLHST